MNFKGELLSLGGAIRLAMAAVTSMLVLPGMAANQNAADKAKFAPGQVLVQFKANAAEAHRQDALGKAKAKVKKHVHNQHMRDKGHPGVVVAETELDVAEAVAQLKEHPAVEFAEPNWIYKHQATANDPYFTGGQLWGVYGSASTPANANGSAAAGPWSFGVTGSASVVVGVIDEGVQWSHPDLRANIWTNRQEAADGLDNDRNVLVDDVRGWNFYDWNNSVFQSGGDDHGTHVAGTVGATGGNGVGIAGVNWRVTIVPVKFLGPDGGSTSDAINALDYLSDLKARQGLDLVAVNCSWGGEGYSQALHDAVIRAAKAGILVVVAAGNGDAYGRGINNDTLKFYPANYNTTAGTSTESGAGYNAVISVAAIDSAGRLAQFSNYGSGSVHLGAPGVGIYSTVPLNSYSPYNGTSMATPHVTGGIALHAAARPNDSVTTIRQQLLANVVPTTALAEKTTTGGRLNVGYLAPSGSGTTNSVQLVAGELKSPRIEANRFVVMVQGASNQVYEVEVSSNLTQWVMVGRATNTTGVLQISDTLSAQWPRKFYRTITSAN